MAWFQTQNKMTSTAQLSTINDLFCRVAAAANPRAVLWQDEFGHWLPISSNQIYQRVRALAETFLSWGAKKGDRIALISENRWEWAVSDFATLAIGAVNVPIYPTLTGEQIAVLLQDAGCRIAIVSTRQQFDKLNAVRAQTPLERILIMDSAAPPEGAIAFSEVLAGADARGPARDPVFDALVQTVKPEDLATLIYTSGTTGEPKGVMLTHGNIAANQNLAAIDFGFNSTDACISFLPLSHITARALDYVMYSYGAQVCYCSQFDKLPQAMKRSEAHSLCGRAARVRKDSPGGRAEIERFAGEEEDLRVGNRSGRQASRRGVCGKQASFTGVETCEQAGIFKGARGIRRKGEDFCRGWRAAGHRHGEMVCLGRNSRHGKGMG